jgi:uncharacterized membrane protein
MARPNRDSRIAAEMRADFGARKHRESQEAIFATGLCVAGVLLSFFGTRPSESPREAVLFGFVPGVIVLYFAWRYLNRRVLERKWRDAWAKHKLEAEFESRKKPNA